MERLILLNTIADTQQLESFVRGTSVTSVATAQAGQKITDIIAGAESVLLADRRLLNTGCNLGSLLEDEKNSTATLFAIEYPDENASINSLSADGIVAAMTQPGHIPAMMIKLPSSFLMQEGRPPGFSGICRALIKPKHHSLFRLRT